MRSECFVFESKKSQPQLTSLNSHSNMSNNEAKPDSKPADGTEPITVRVLDQVRRDFVVECDFCDLAAMRGRVARGLERRPNGLR